MTCAPITSKLLTSSESLSALKQSQSFNNVPIRCVVAGVRRESNTTMRLIKINELTGNHTRINDHLVPVWGLLIAAGLMMMARIQ
jgi:hypothetical protein